MPRMIKTALVGHLFYGVHSEGRGSKLSKLSLAVKVKKVNYVLHINIPSPLLDF
jgi:hypothetical protein